MRQCDIAGCEMYRPLILRSDEGVLIPLAKPEVLVGRRLGCDIVIQYPTVSVHHFRINCVASNGYWYVEDLPAKMALSSIVNA